MSFLAPMWLAAAAAVAVGVVVAHLFSTSVPQRDYLPTVRFVPEGAPMAVMRTRRLSDIALLLLRLLAVALLGFALAGAYVKRGGPSRIVLVDASRAVAAFAEARDSAVSSGGDAVFVVFDSLARVVSRDSLAGTSPSSARGSLSAALVAAHRSVARVSTGREDIELVIVSPAVREQVDSATASLLELWPGPVRHVRVATANPPAGGQVTVRALGDDPVAAAMNTADPSRAARAQDDRRRGQDDKRSVILSEAKDLLSSVRIVRTSPTRGDSIWARDSGGVLVLWPADMSSGVLAQRAPADTQNGIAAGSNVVVASFARTHQPRPGRSIVRWADGETAAAETPLSRGCVREAAIPVDGIGDVALRESFRGVVDALTEPCGGARDFAADSVILSKARDLLSTADPSPAARAQNDRARFARDDTMAIWLAALALALLIAEQLLRARARAAT